MEDCIVVMVTVESEAQADAVSNAVLEPRLAACVNTIPGIKSRYWWQGKLESAQEWLLVIKTREANLAALIDAVKAAHSYSVPEVIALPIAGGNPAYLSWLAAEASAA